MTSEIRMPPPRPFTEETYSAWHHATFPGDAPLVENIEKLRADLAASSRSSLSVLGQVLTYTANYCRFEYEKAAKTPTGYLISLSEALREKPGSPLYD